MRMSLHLFFNFWIEIELLTIFCLLPQNEIVSDFCEHVWMGQLF